jgi:hypothetical protein
MLNLCIRWDITDPLHVLATLPLQKDGSAPTVQEVGWAVEPVSCSFWVLKHICLVVQPAALSLHQIHDSGSVITLQRFVSIQLHWNKTDAHKCSFLRNIPHSALHKSEEVSCCWKSYYDTHNNVWLPERTSHFNAHFNAVSFSHKYGGLSLSFCREFLLYIHTYMHTYIHTYIHTHTHIMIINVILFYFCDKLII